MSTEYPLFLTCTSRRSLTAVLEVTEDVVADL